MIKYLLPDEPVNEALIPELYRDTANSITLRIGNSKTVHDVITLRPDGRMLVHTGLPTGLGLKVDQDGRIKTVNE